MNAPIDTYHIRELGIVSNTALTKFRESPLAYYDWITGEEQEPTEAMHDGTAFHCALLEPEKFAKRYVTIPDMPLRSKDDKQAFLDATLGEILGIQATANGEKADELRGMVAARLAQSGVHLMAASDLDLMRRMVASLNMPCHRVQRALVARGKKEHVIRWKDRETQLQCKAKIDSWDEATGIESDLKRTVKITERQFRYACLDHDYHFQRAFYRRGLRELGEDPKYQCFVAAYPMRPFYWASYDLPAEVIEACDAEISSVLRRFAECLSKNEWPTINNGEPRTLDIRAEYI